MGEAIFTVLDDSVEEQCAMEISGVCMYILVQTSDILSGGLVDVSHGSG